jgi:predicted metal-dependent peptidase
MNAMQEMEQQAYRMVAEEKAMAKIGKARARLVLGEAPEVVFFASICMGWLKVPRWDLPTLAVDGTHLFFNPDFTNSLTDDEMRAVIVHEAMHDALGHHYRFVGLDHRRANIAADLAINGIVETARFLLPKGRLMPGEKPFEKMPKMKSMEEYYRLLPTEKDGKYGQPGDDPGGCGGLAVPGDGSPADIREAEAMCKERIAAAREKAKSGYSWIKPNRRFLSQGIYMPGRMSEALGHGIIGQDASGSCWDKSILDRFAGEVNGILSAFNVRLTILCHDTRVTDSYEWKPGDGPLVLKPKGGGGTDHHCLFEWVKKKGIKPAFMVCLTDMYSSFPSKAPDYPVLWCSVSKGVKAPWGELLEVDL